MFANEIIALKTLSITVKGPFTDAKVSYKLPYDITMSSHTRITIYHCFGNDAMPLIIQKCRAFSWCSRYNSNRSIVSHRIFLCLNSEHGCNYTEASLLTRFNFNHSMLGLELINVSHALHSTAWWSRFEGFLTLGLVISPPWSQTSTQQGAQWANLPNWPNSHLD